MGLYFPEHGDPDFREKLMELEEYQNYQVPPLGAVESQKQYEELTHRFCAGFEKTLYQHLMQHYLSYRSPYRSLLLYHGLGVGKTCSSITIAESLLVDHSQREPPRIWVILPTTLQDAYQGQLFSLTKLLDVNGMMEQCTQDTYVRLTASAKDAETKRKRIEQVIRGRYKMMTYEGFATEVEKLKNAGKLHTITNKVIIVDEAHNLRIEETDKRASAALMEVATKCQNNRLVLLSATPMYNEPDEIFWLLSLLLANDKRTIPSFKPLYTTKDTPSKSMFAKLQQLASEYISYIRGTNPFTFAARLSPKHSGERLLTQDWTVSIHDGIVPTELGAEQKRAIDAFDKSSDAVFHQANNVCFPSGASYKVGKKGIDSVLSRETDESPYQYKMKGTNFLMPTEDKLGKYGAKLKGICDRIRNSHGIVVVYSQFVWGGIVPLAMALEHMGFQRYGTRNLLVQPEIAEPRANYPGIPFPSYCVLSGDTQIMGSTNIEKLVTEISRLENMRGERIKVVLMSPIAGEGLSLKNVREVHIMDPWYHMNRINQVVGRAIRTCSHIALPIRERNVTVYLHAATNGKSETMDIRTYKIAARKSYQTAKAEQEIRDHAMDCALVKNVHYYPKNMFKFDVLYVTSRGVEVPHHFGDDPMYEPRCALPTKRESITMRSETITEITPTGMQRLRKYMQQHQKIRYSFDELAQALDYPRAISLHILEKACKPDAIMQGYHLQRHGDDGFVLRHPSKMEKPSKIRVSSSRVSVKPQQEDKVGYELTIASIPTNNQYEAIVRIYQSLDSDSWPTFAQRVVQDIPQNIRNHVELLAAEGVFILSTELPTHKPYGNSKYIGYFDVFDVQQDHIILWDDARKMFRDATTSETSKITERRKLFDKPDAKQTTYLFGSLEPYVHKQQTVKRLQFKLYVPGPSAGKKTGIVCINTKKPNIAEALDNLGVKYTDEDMSKETKDTLCYTLSHKLLEKRRLYLSPRYKPAAYSI